jgi:hypothetical protein
MIYRPSGGIEATPVVGEVEDPPPPQPLSQGYR